MLADHAPDVASARSRCTYSLPIWQGEVQIAHAVAQRNEGVEATMGRTTYRNASLDTGTIVGPRGASPGAFDIAARPEAMDDGEGG